MGFSGREIIFNGIPSSFYNLYLETPDGAESESPAGSSVEPIIEENIRRPVPYLLGVRHTPVLSFDIALYSPDELDAKFTQLALRWLTGNATYKKLQIVQDDLSDIYFNCLITNTRIHRVGNKIQGLRFHVVCDSQWAWSFDQSLSLSFPGTAPTSYPFKIYNQSDDQGGYLYPLVSFTMKPGGGAVYIRNKNDADRLCSFGALSAFEKITIDNDLKIITSSLNLLRIGNFNKHWFRLLPGMNELSVTGNISSLQFDYKFPRKIG
jgi:phage-related protein